MHCHRQSSSVSGLEFSITSFTQSAQRIQRIVTLDPKDLESILWILWSCDIIFDWDIIVLMGISL
jgi:hypothetical protein